MNKNQEWGRSMVEMLGVLAIIGVLSVGGIAAYTTAMNQHRANELQQELTLRATSIAGQLIHEGTGSLSEFPQEVSGHTITYVPVAGDNKFTLSATNVSESICQKLKQAIGDNSIIRTIEPETCVDNGTMVFTFNNDLSTTPQASDFTTEEKCTPPYTWCTELNQCISGNTCTTCSEKYAGSTTSITEIRIGKTNCYCPDDTEFQDQSCISPGPYCSSHDCIGNISSVTKVSKSAISCTLHTIQDFGCTSEQIGGTDCTATFRSKVSLPNESAGYFLKDENTNQVVRLFYNPSTETYGLSTSIVTTYKPLCKN